MINDENIIIKKFFTEDMCKEIIDYINSYAKIFPYSNLNNIKYKKNLEYIDNIHYQINSYFQRVLNIDIRPHSSYLQKCSASASTINQFELATDTLCFHYFLSNCSAYVDDMDEINIAVNQGIVCKSNNKISLKCNEETYIISFYFIYDEVKSLEVNK